MLRSHSVGRAKKFRQSQIAANRAFFCLPRASSTCLKIAKSLLFRRRLLWASRLKPTCLTKTLWLRSSLDKSVPFNGAKKLVCEESFEWRSGTRVDLNAVKHAEQSVVNQEVLACRLLRAFWDRWLVRRPNLIKRSPPTKYQQRHCRRPIRTVQIYPINSHGRHPRGFRQNDSEVFCDARQWRA